MSQRVILLLILLSSIVGHLSQAVLANPFVYQGLPTVRLATNAPKTYAGTINNSSIEMKLTRDGNKITGSYFYTKYKKEITLTGNMNAAGYFRLVEEDENHGERAVFVGSFVNNEAMVGFWYKTYQIDKALPFQVVEAGKDVSSLIERSYQPSMVNTDIAEDNGRLQLFFIGEKLLGLAYQSVRGKAHYTCSIEVFRVNEEEGIIWMDKELESTVVFTKDFFNDDENNSAKIVCRKMTNGYRLSFDRFSSEGDSLAYFCGMGNSLPGEIVVTKGKNGWLGKLK